jgi:hypothetical protein
MTRIFVSISLLLTLLASSFGAYPQESVPAGLRMISPNGRYSVELTEIDKQWRYAIKDMQTGRLDSSIVMPTVLLYLHWAASSQCLVAVEHVAKGSCGRVIYLTNGKWTDVGVRPPGNGWMDSAVVNLDIKFNYVHYRFVVRHIKDNGMPIDHKFCDLDVDLRTGRIFNVNWTLISEAEEEANLARKPSYVPPMKER